MAKLEPIEARDLRMINAVHMGRKADDLVQLVYADTRSILATAKHFKLSEAEVRFIVLTPDRRIQAGYRK